MFLIFSMYALLGGSYIFSKILLGVTKPLFLIGTRMLLGGSILLTYQYFFAYDGFKFKKEHIWLYIQVILFSIIGTYILRLWALNHMTATKTSFFQTTSPFVAALFSYWFFSEKMSIKKWLGLFIGLIGIIPMLITSSSTEKIWGEIFFISLPEAAMLLSVTLHTYGWIVIRKLGKQYHYAPSMINAIAMTAGGILALIISLPLEGLLPVSNTTTFVSFLAIFIITSNIIVHNLCAYLLKSYTATFMSFTSFLTPLFTALYGWLFLHEQVSWHFYVSCGIVITGLYIFYQEELKHIRQEKEQAANNNCNGTGDTKCSAS